MEFKHIPVLLDETINALNIRPDGVYVDGTAGGGGHSAEISKRLSSGRLIAIDRDPAAVTAAGERLKGLNADVVNDKFSNMRAVLRQFGINEVNGVLLDLGVSSFQLDCAERGFSYHADAPLDMRMSGQGRSAADIVNGESEQELVRIFRDYGEERFAVPIARSIVKLRSTGQISSTGELAELISRSVPSSARRDGHPARRCFQALRIAVNSELDEVNIGIREAFDLLCPGGVLAVITFHSLEDRIVKQFFAEVCRGCICPPELPVCVCGRKPQGSLVTRKPVAPSEKEISENPRSRSAKLRAVKKI